MGNLNCKYAVMLCKLPIIRRFNSETVISIGGAKRSRGIWNIDERVKKKTRKNQAFKSPSNINDTRVVSYQALFNIENIEAISKAFIWVKNNIVT